MGDVPESPLAEARRLLAEVRQQAGDDIQPRLADLERLLAQAQARGEGEDAAALRQQIAGLIKTQAQFVSVMVHEVRGPMTSIRGYADMLAKDVVGPLNDMQRQFVETIHANVLRMERLVSDISDLSKLRSGRLKLEPKLDTYKNIALQVEKETAALAAEHSHTLVFDTPPGLPPLNLDSARLAQALGKLVINALHYTPDGGQITVRAEDVGGRVKVSVSDNGIGMTPDEQAHVGELFWRADSEQVRAIKGHGLGLPIAMGLIELMGGEFFFESQPGVGSTFGFIVPAAAT